jgi:hypothetical protein
MIQSEPQTGSIGMDGSYIDGGALQWEQKFMAMVKLKLLHYNFSKDGKDVQS